MGGEEGMDNYDKNIRYRGSLQNYLIDTGSGYVYDPADNGGIPFEELPDDWRCPHCRQPKAKFNKA